MTRYGRFAIRSLGHGIVSFVLWLGWGRLGMSSGVIALGIVQHPAFFVLFVYGFLVKLWLNTIIISVHALSMICS